MQIHNQPRRRYSTLRHCRSFKAALLVVIALLGVGCNPRIGIAIGDVSVTAWEESVTLCFENEQPRLCDMNIFLHINRTYTADSVELDICAMTPDSLRYSESIKFATPVEWRGANAKSSDIEIPYRQNINLRHAGNYYFEITPRKTVSGIEAIGVSFVESKDKNESESEGGVESGAETTI